MADAALVLAITADDVMFHVGNGDAIIAHLFPPSDTDGRVLAMHGTRPERPWRAGRTAGGGRRAGHAWPGEPPPLELYDATGRALRVVNDASGRPATLEPSGVGDADPALLVARIDGILDRAREHLADHPEEEVSPEAIPGAKGPLPAVLAFLAAYDTGPAPGVHDSPADLAQQWVAIAFESVFRRAPRLAGTVASAAARVPLVGRFSPSTADPGDVGPGGGGPTLPPGSIPHRGSWFHNLMHRLTG